MKDSNISIAIIGGSGFWTEINHAPNIIYAIKKYPENIKNVYIVDPRNPANQENYPNIKKLLKSNKTQYITPRVNISETVEYLKKIGVDLLIIASDPVSHYDYILNGLQYGINIICDKPIFNNKNASTSTKAAKQIYKKFEILCNEYKKQKSINNRLFCILLLRRRTLPVFNDIANNLNYIYQETGAGINNANLVIHNGIFKHPNEFMITGAHGYTKGIGSLSHSAYHYLDLLIWYIEKAPGNITKISPRLSNIFRVKDYIESDLPNILFGIRNGKQILSESILGSELDVGFYIDLFDSKNKKCGAIHFANNHLSVTNRTRKFDINNDNEPANFIDGGRMSHITIDIHQSGQQNIQLFKNDIALNSSKIVLKIRRNPSIKGENYIEKEYNNAYKASGNELKNTFMNIIDSMVNHSNIDENKINDLLDESKTFKLFSEMYELIAKDFEDKKGKMYE